MLWASIRATERRFSTIIRGHAIPREIVMGREGRAGRNLAINLARESCKNLDKKNANFGEVFARFRARFLPAQKVQNFAQNLARNLARKSCDRTGLSTIGTSREGEGR